jgi:perosamine synthetase
MTNICAAIGMAQLEMIPEIIKRKWQVAQWYEKYCPYELLNILGLPWMVCMTTSNKDRLREHLSKHGIETRPVFYPVHKLPMYAKGQVFPVAERISSMGINLPSYPDLEESDVKEICRELLFFKRRKNINFTI